MEKEYIYYHRSYRKAERLKILVLILYILLLVSFFDLIIYFSLPYLTHYISYFVKTLLPVENIKIVKSFFLLTNIYYVSFPGKIPSLYFSKIVAIISFLSLILFPMIKKIPRNFSLWLVLVCLIILVSALFFVFFPEKFPYTLTDFSELYIKTEVAIWLCLIPFIIAFLTVPLPESLLNKGILIAIILIYSIIFGGIRYFVFLYVLWKYSYLFMSPLFFIFGPLVDFLYIIGIYTFYLSRLALKLKGENKVWLWT